jgi:hypothetical protein
MTDMNYRFANDVYAIGYELLASTVIGEIEIE